MQLKRAIFHHAANCLFVNSDKRAVTQNMSLTVLGDSLYAKPIANPTPEFDLQAL
jgi:hypothetical protein